MTNSPRLDRNTLYSNIWEVVGKKVGYGIDCDVLTDQICDAVMKWVPKHGDFWLDDNGMLWVNRGWGAVTPGALE